MLSPFSKFPISSSFFSCLSPPFLLFFSFRSPFLVFLFPPSSTASSLGLRPLSSPFLSLFFVSPSFIPSSPLLLSPLRLVSPLLFSLLFVLSLPSLLFLCLFPSFSLSLSSLFLLLLPFLYRSSLSSSLLSLPPSFFFFVRFLSLSIRWGLMLAASLLRSTQGPLATTLWGVLNLVLLLLFMVMFRFFLGLVLALLKVNPPWKALKPLGCPPLNELNEGSKKALNIQYSAFPKSYAVACAPHSSPLCFVSPFKLKLFPPVDRGPIARVRPPMEVAEQGAKYWDTTLVGYFLGRRLPFSLVQPIAFCIWKDQGIFSVLSSKEPPPTLISSWPSLGTLLKDTLFFKSGE